MGRIEAKKARWDRRGLFAFMHIYEQLKLPKKLAEIDLEVNRPIPKP